MMGCLIALAIGTGLLGFLFWPLWLITGAAIIAAAIVGTQRR